MMDELNIRIAVKVHLFLELSALKWFFEVFCERHLRCLKNGVGERFLLWVVSRSLPPCDCKWCGCLTGA